VSAVAGPRPLDGASYFPIGADPDKGADVFLVPMLATLVIEVDAEEVARMVYEYRIDAYHVTPILILSDQMFVNVMIRQRREPPIGALGALISLLITKCFIPLVGANRLIAGLFRGGAIPPPSKDILPPFEERPK
jgi:hypothetical protein